MSHEKRLNQVIECLRHCANDGDCETCLRWEQYCENRYCVDDLMIVAAEELKKYADAAEVVHGRWGIIGGDLHSNGYPVVCTVCNKAHFVHYKKSLGGLNLNELFELPKYCPNCGADMQERKENDN